MRGIFFHVMPSGIPERAGFPRGRFCDSAHFLSSSHSSSPRVSSAVPLASALAQITWRVLKPASPAHLAEQALHWAANQEGSQD